MRPLLKFTSGKISFLVTVFLVLLYFSTAQSTLMRNLEAKALDLRFHLRELKDPGTQIVLVLIDDKSIATLGRWPWSRSQFAEIVRLLKQAGARVIAFDLLFLEPESNSGRDTLQAVRSLLESMPFFRLAPEAEVFRQKLIELEEATDPDQQFGAALSEAGNVLLPFSFVFSAARENPAPSLAPAPDFVSRSAYRAVQYRESSTPALPLVAERILSPLALLGRQAVALGHVNVSFDTDGTPRYDYPVIEYQGEYYPSLGLQAARTYLGLTPEEMKIRFGEGIQLGNIFIPTDQSMRMLANYYGPRGSFPSMSFADVLHGSFPASTFKDKIVLIGGAAVGLGDTFGTPFSSALPGVERHANIIATILQKGFLVRPNAPELIDLFSLAMIGLLLGGLSPRFPPLWGNCFALGLGGLFVGLNILIFIKAGIWINLFFPLLAIMLIQGALTLYRLLIEEREKRMIRRAFQHYLHPAVIDQVSENPQLLTLGGEEKELTVLFSDIRSFSAISEPLSPPQLVQLLNEYLTAMTDIVLGDNGLLDKYIGDAIMAVYGAPLPMQDHAYRACHTALHMMTRLRALQKSWKARGFPVIDIGIGINTGCMVVGNMGSEQRFDYTVMGDEVNLGSRLEGANKEFGTHIIISESTWKQAGDRIVARELDIIQAKGKKAPTRIFEVLGFSPPTPVQTAIVERFAEGLQAYRSQQWDQAIRRFEQVLERAPHDRPSQIYIQRCLGFKADPPLSSWEGIHVMQAK